MKRGDAYEKEFEKESGKSLGKNETDNSEQLWNVGSRTDISLNSVIIGLVLIFKTQLTNLVETIFAKITSESAGI